MTLTRPLGVSVIPDTFQPHQWDQYLSKVARLRPSAAFVIGNVNRAYEIKALCADDAHVVYRVYDPYGEQGDPNSFDNQFHQLHRNPRQVVDHMMMTHGNILGDFIMCYGYNEPGHDDSRRGFELDQLLNWFIDWAYETHAEGIRCTIGEFATDKTIKYFDVPDIQNKRWDKFIKMTDDLCRDWHDLTAHSYSSYLVMINQLIQMGASPLNRDQLQHEAWRSIKLATTKIPFQGGEVFPPYYSTGRELAVTEIRARELGLQPIPYGLTECGFDRKEYLPFYEEAKNRFNRNPVQDPLRGYLGHWHYCAWIHGVEPEQLSPDVFADWHFNNLKAYITSHPSRLRYITPFTSAHSGEWLISGFNQDDDRNDIYWERAARFNDEFERAMLDPDIPEEPDDPIIIDDDPINADKRFPDLDDPDWVTGTVVKNHTGAYTNVRSTPRVVNGATSNMVTRIYGDLLDAKLNLSADWVRVVDDITFIPIILIENDIKGWVSGDYINFVQSEVIDEPDDPTPPDDSTPDDDNDLPPCRDVFAGAFILTIIIMMMLVIVACIPVVDLIPTATTDLTPSETLDPTPSQEFFIPSETPD